MATVGSIPSSLFQQDASGVNGNTSNNGTPGSTIPGSDQLANESTFLQLLVAQLKNQNPSQPMDGTTFVTQLAQFSDLEQNLAMRQDLDSINAKYVGTAATSNAGTDDSNKASGTQGS
jgi:flagellar basal-body rod modification protein FlgD